MSAIDRYVAKANAFLKELAGELGLEYPAQKDKALRILRTVLHTLRDRISAEESLDLIAQLPLIIKGIYVDGWRTSTHPIKRFKHVDEFVQAIMERDPNDFKDPQETLQTIKKVFKVIERHVSEGEIKDIKSVLPEELRELL